MQQIVCSIYFTRDLLIHSLKLHDSFVFFTTCTMAVKLVPVLCICDNIQKTIFKINLKLRQYLYVRHGNPMTVHKKNRNIEKRILSILPTLWLFSELEIDTPHLKPNLTENSFDFDFPPFQFSFFMVLKSCTGSSCLFSS